MWNYHLGQQCFDHATTQSILDMPLFPQAVKDELTWKKKNPRYYTIKSTYRLCLKEILDNSYLHRLGQWMGIWKLIVPVKVKIFAIIKLPNP